MSIHRQTGLTGKEKRLSAEATKELCFEVIVWQDSDRWVCDPRSPHLVMGYGDTWQQAAENCRVRNTKER